MLFFFGYSLPAPPFPPGAPDCVPASPCRKAGAGAMSACGNRFSSAPAGRPRCPATSPPCFARHIIPRIAPYEKKFCGKSSLSCGPPSCLRHQRGHRRLPCRRSPGTTDFPAFRPADIPPYNKSVKGAYLASRGRFIPYFLPRGKYWSFPFSRGRFSLSPLPRREGGIQGGWA